MVINSVDYIAHIENLVGHWLFATQKRWRTGALFPCHFKKGATGAELPFHNSIIGIFMAYQDQLETNLLQLCAHPENSEWFL